MFRQGEGLRAPRWEHNHCWMRGLPLPWMLFQPGFIGNEASDFHGTTFLSVTECDGDLLEDLYGNVVLSGGTIMFDGIGECMTKQLTDLTPSL